MNYKLEEAKPHTIKKFEIINNYVADWARKILGYGDSKGVVYIDCMCNAGMYRDERGNEVKGTAILVAETLKNTIKDYPGKKAVIFFNDLDPKKIECLKSYIKQFGLENDSQFTIITANRDRDEFITNLEHVMRSKAYGYNTLLVYDPYNATLNWDAISPYINRWGEVIINHMVSDTARGAKQAKRQTVKEKYQETYQQAISKIVEIGTDRSKLDALIFEIIKDRASDSYDTFIASFPFFNRKNTVVYNLIFCTHHIEGIKLFKKKAWQAFGGKSSLKDTHGLENQMTIDFETGEAVFATADEGCYYIKDVAKYVVDKFGDRDDVMIDEIYDDLDRHPVFPSDGYKNEIKKELKERYGAEIKRGKPVVFRK